MGKLVEEYKALLNGNAQASDKFWALWERMKRDKRSPGVMLEDLSYVVESWTWEQDES